MQKFKILNLTKKYIEQIYEIESVSFGKHHWSKDSFIKELNNPCATYFGIFSTNLTLELCGYIGLWQVLDEGHITTLAVAPLCRNVGLADKLLYHLILNSISKNIKWLTLEVRVSNKAATNLYKKHNFKEMGIRKKYYYDNNEDALILWKDLFGENVHADKLHYSLS